jgi:hypothetical protein
MKNIFFNIIINYQLKSKEIKMRKKTLRINKKIKIKRIINSKY